MWLAGPALCFLLNALSFLAVLAALALMDVNGNAPEAPRGASRPALWDGLRFVAGRRDLLLLMGMTAAVGLFAWPILSLLTAVAGRRLDANANGFGYGMLLCAFGVGALPSTLLAASCDSPAMRRRFLAAGVVLTAAGLLGLAAAGSLTPALLCCALLGGGLILFNSTSQTIMQLSADDHNRGRVLSIWSMVLSIAAPVGGLAAGQAVDLLNVPAVLAVLAAGLIASAAVVFVLARGVKLGAAPTREPRRAAERCSKHLARASRLTGRRLRSTPPLRQFHLLEVSRRRPALEPLVQVGGEVIEVAAGRLRHPFDGGADGLPFRQGAQELIFRSRQDGMMDDVAASRHRQQRFRRFRQAGLLPARTAA